jgi:UDP-glucose 4-epimerase
MKMLVTGGAGFIGSNLVDELVSLGHDVICIDNESSESNEKFYWNGKAQNYKYDICEYNQINNLFEGVDVVFHMASTARVQPSILEPSRVIRSDVLGTSNVLEAARMNNVKRVILSSTASAYGTNNKLPNIETQKEDCLTPYSAAKIFGENIAKVYFNLYGLKTICLRYFNVYGERQPIKGDYSPVIGLFLEQDKKNLPLTVVGDGSQKRDFTYVKDVVSANILAATKDVDDSVFGQTYNIGFGKNYSILHVAWMISSSIKFVSKRPGELQESLSNSDKFKKAFGWDPQTTLSDWIKKTIDKSNSKEV